MMEINFIHIETVISGEPVDHRLLHEILALGLIEYRQHDSKDIFIEESNCEDLRAMLRLATELQINPAGIETIMHMRSRINDLLEENKRLRKIERAYRALRP